MSQHLQHASLQIRVERLWNVRVSFLGHSMLVM